MNDLDRQLTGMAVLINLLTRTLVANNVISKIDLLADLSRIQHDIPDPVLVDVQSLIQNLPDR